MTIWSALLANRDFFRISAAATDDVDIFCWKYDPIYCNTDFALANSPFKNLLVGELNISTKFRFSGK